MMRSEERLVTMVMMLILMIVTRPRPAAVHSATCVGNISGRRQAGSQAMVVIERADDNEDDEDCY